jgi:hypothetical protein
MNLFDREQVFILSKIGYYLLIDGAAPSNEAHLLKWRIS